jgi:hypothetical protein
MEERRPPAGYPGHWEMKTHEYRVVIWEKPLVEGKDPEFIGWGEETIDLVGVEDVHEAIEWAERRLVEGIGPYSRGGRPVQDREYVLYAKLPDGEDRFVWIAGWNPVRDGGDLSGGKNLRRRPH